MHESRSERNVQESRVTTSRSVKRARGKSANDLTRSHRSLVSCRSNIVKLDRWEKERKTLLAQLNRERNTNATLTQQVVRLKKQKNYEKMYKTLKKEFKEMFLVLEASERKRKDQEELISDLQRQV